MPCFNHKDAVDLGMCCYCCKSLCKECFDLKNNRLVCKESPCEEELDKIEFINRRAVEIYGYGKKRRIPMMSFMYIIFGFLMAGFGGYYLDWEGPSYLIIALGIFIILVGLVMYIRASKYKLDVW